MNTLARSASKGRRRFVFILEFFKLFPGAIGFEGSESFSRFSVLNVILLLTSMGQIFTYAVDFSEFFFHNNLIKNKNVFGAVVRK